MRALVLGILTGLLGAQTLQPQELAQWLKDREEGKKHFLLVDVRTPQEHEQGFIPGTDTLIPLSLFQRGEVSLPINPEKDTLVVYCRTGRRSGIVQRMLESQGFKWVYNGLGIMQWQQAGYSLTTGKEKNSANDEGKSTSAIEGVVPPSRVCMTQNTVFDHDLIPVVVNGKTYYGCCPGCAAALQQDPRYTWATDPVSGKRVDKAEAVILNHHGIALYFESMETLRAFKQDPEKFLRKGDF